MIKKTLFAFIFLLPLSQIQANLRFIQNDIKNEEVEFHLDYESLDKQFHNYINTDKSLKSKPLLTHLKRMEDLPSLKLTEDNLLRYNSFSKPDRIPEYTRIITKNKFYSNTDWTPPKIAFYGKANYGFWDAAFLWFLLENYDTSEDYKLFFYHHLNTPAIQDFKNDVVRYSNIDPTFSNAFYTLENEARKINSKIDKDYVPENIEPGVYLSKKFISSLSDDMFSIGTFGNTDQDDHQACFKIKRAASFDVICERTEDNVQNAVDFVNDKLTSFYALSDTWNDYTNAYNQGFPKFQGVFKEPILLYFLAHKKSNVGNINDLKNNKYNIYAIGYNTEESLNLFKEKLPEFKTAFEDIKVYREYAHYFDVIKNDEKAIVFYACTIDCKELADVDKRYAEHFELLPLNFWKLNSEQDIYGNPVYGRIPLPYKYPNLQNKSLFGSGDTYNIFLYKYFIISNQWIKRNPDDIQELEKILKSEK